ncbi:hypothetical protein AOQ84DRAFT_302904 [Glonium stellatum]|uniref:EthD domain-containing protein n=1 Tax=Glonium stellatum TaxID=574774 RepID=A0A8E2JN04_9PEZI|nr:hypothetical protein AOQ84DRAFT_302904 [Glonium stellatum]
MATPTEAGSKLLVWTVCAFRKAGMEEEEFHRYMTEVYAPLVRDLLVTHNTSATRSLMAQIRDIQFQNDADYDMVTQIRFPDTQNFVNFRNNPFYKEKIMADHDHFTDPERVFMSVGWVEGHIIDGQVAD